MPEDVIVVVDGRGRTTTMKLSDARAEAEDYIARGELLLAKRDQQGYLSDGDLRRLADGYHAAEALLEQTGDLKALPTLSDTFRQVSDKDDEDQVDAQRIAREAYEEAQRRERERRWRQERDERLAAALRAFEQLGQDDDDASGTNVPPVVGDQPPHGTNVPVTVKAIARSPGYFAVVGGGSTALFLGEQAAEAEAKRRRA
jgi:hypothetical protein